MPAFAAALPTVPDLTKTGFALLALAVFIVAYVFVAAEEFTELRKSKPMVVAATIAWILVALAWEQHGLSGAADLLRRAG